MKKIIIAFISMFSMLIFIATPLFVKPIKANAATSLGITDDTSTNEWFLAFSNIKAHYGDDLYYAYVTLHENSGEAETVCLIFDNCELATDEGYTQRFSSTDIPLNVYIKNPTLNGGKPKIVRRHRNEYGDVTVLQEIADYNIDYFGFRYDSTGTGNINYKVFISCYRTLQNGSTESLSINIYQSKVFRYNSNDSEHNKDRQTQFILPTETGSIDVTFNPSLSGVVTRSSVNDNGVSGLSNYFSMTVENNTAYGCQYRMMIKDTNGQAVTTYHQGDSDTNYQPNWENGFSVNDDGSFVYINDEWIYVSPTIGGGVCKALKPSEWHYVGANDSITQNFTWSQFDFKKDHTYICMVYALTNDLGCATALDSSRTGLYNSYPDYCLDFTTQALVYQTVFTISNPATFNPNDNSFGNKIRNGNWSGDKGEFSAYEDPSNGNTISGNGNVDELRNLPNSVVSGGSHGGGGYSTYHDATLNNIYGSGSYTSNRSFAQLNSYFGGYFGFLSSIIGFYPSPYQTLIMIGFAGLVVIGILKAAIK